MAEDTLPSFNSQLRALPKGETLSRAKRFPLGKADPDDMNESLQTMRRTLNATVSRIRESTGNNFRVESGFMLTNDNAAMVAVVAVTRL